MFIDMESSVLIQLARKGFHNGLTVLSGHLLLQFGQDLSGLQLAVFIRHLHRSRHVGGLAAVLKSGELHGKNQSLLEL